MRWSFWPVSIVAHVLAGLAMLIVPLTADVSWPVPAPLHRLAVATKVVPVPPEVVARVPVIRAIPNPPGVARPNSLAPAHDLPEAPPVAPNFGFPSTATGPIDPDLLGPPGVPVPGPPSPPPVPEKKTTAQVFRVGQGVREPKRIAGAPPDYPSLAARCVCRGW